MTGAQSDFVAALMDPAAEVPNGLIGPAGDGAGRRFDVYRNNVAVSLTEALETAFPVLAKLLGEANFKGLAGIYLRRHPPENPLMMYYGQAMPTFLAGLPQLAHLPYLADVARLELALREAYHAADVAPVAPEAFGALAPDALMAALLRLHPAVRLIVSDWPVHAIWARNMTADAPKPVMVAQSVLISRPALDPVQTLLPAGTAEFIAALGEGLTFGDALDRAMAPEFDLPATLAAIIAAGAVTSIETSS